MQFNRHERRKAAKLAKQVAKPIGKVVSSTLDDNGLQFTVAPNETALRAISKSSTQVGGWV